jgi:hypothetical protein
MSEKTVTESREVGYRWLVSIDKELRTETGAKYPDKTEIHATLEGHEQDADTAVKNLENAKKVLKDLTKEL